MISHAVSQMEKPNMTKVILNDEDVFHKCVVGNHTMKYYSIIKSALVLHAILHTNTGGCLKTQSCGELGLENHGNLLMEKFQNQ